MSLWGGRFDGKVDPVMERFNSSISFDKRLCFVDIDGSKGNMQEFQKINFLAYVMGLLGCGLLNKDEANQITSGLDEVYREWENGKPYSDCNLTSIKVSSRYLKVMKTFTLLTKED